MPGCPENTTTSHIHHSIRHTMVHLSGFSHRLLYATGWAILVYGGREAWFEWKGLG